MGRCWPPRGQPPCAQNSTVGSRGGFPPGRARRLQRRGGWEHTEVPGGPTRLTADSGRPAGGSLPLRARPCWVRRSAGRGGKAAGRGGDLWAFQPSRCLFGPPIVSSASQRGCCRRSAGPRCGLHGREGPGPREPSVRLRTPVGASFRATSVRLSAGSRPCALGVHPWALPACPARGNPAPRPCARGPGACFSRAVGHPAPPGWHGPRRVPGAHTGAHSSRLRATIWQILVDTAAPAHSGAECPATGNNHNSVRVYYRCERARKKKII